MLLYEGYKGTKEFKITHHGVNLYNWQNHLDNAIRTVIYHTEHPQGQGIQIHTQMDDILTGGEDGPVNDLTTILERMKELICRHASPGNKRTIMEQYTMLVIFVGNRSNQRLGARTIDFCLRYLALKQAPLEKV